MSNVLDLFPERPNKSAHLKRSHLEEKKTLQNFMTGLHVRVILEHRTTFQASFDFDLLHLKWLLLVSSRDDRSVHCG